MERIDKKRVFMSLAACTLAFLLGLGALGFAGCGDKGQAGAADPEDVVESFFEALEEQDISAIIELFDADSLEDIEDDLGSGYRGDLKDYFFDWMPDDAEFKGLRYETDESGKDAEVEVVKGRVDFEDDYGDQASVDIATSDDPITFYLVKGKNGWFLSAESFPDLDDEEATFADLFADYYDDYGYDDYDYDDYDTDTGADNGDTAALEAAMLAYLKANAAEGLQFTLRNLQVYGDEAVGVYECTNMDLEWPMVYMKKGPSGWYGVNAGTGFDVPYWYDWDW